MTKNNFDFYKNEILKITREAQSKDYTLSETIGQLASHFSITRRNSSLIEDLFEWGYKEFRYVLTPYEKSTLEFIRNGFGAKEIYRSEHGHIFFHDADNQHFSMGGIFDLQFGFVEKGESADIDEMLSNCRVESQE